MLKSKRLLLVSVRFTSVRVRFTSVRLIRVRFTSVKRTHIFLSSHPQHHSTLRYVRFLYVTYRHKLIILKVLDIQFAVNPSS